MSELDPKIKANLVKQIESIARRNVDNNNELELDEKNYNHVQTDSTVEQNVRIEQVLDSVEQSIKEPVNHENTVQSISPVSYTPTQASSTMTQQPLAQPVHEKKNDKIDPVMIFAFIALLVLGGLFIVSRIGFNQESTTPQTQTQTIQARPINHQYVPNNRDPHLGNPYHRSLTIDDVKNYLEPWIDQRISRLERRVDRLDHRTWLLAVANNENVQISRRIAYKIGAKDLGNKYISFDGNWNLNKMPEFINLSKQQRYALLDEVDDRNYQRRYEYEYDYRTHRYSPVYNHDQSVSKPYCYTSNNVVSSSYCYPSNTVKNRPIYYNYNYNNCNTGLLRRFLCRPGRLINWRICH